jgi:hypothetical protein
MKRMIVIIMIIVDVLVELRKKFCKRNPCE